MKLMKRSIYLLKTLCAFLGVLLYCTCIWAQKPDAYDIYGHPVYFPAQNTQWTVINYWADWCSSCVKEIPELNKLASMAKEKKFSLFAVNLDKLSPAQQQFFAEQNRIIYPLLRSNPFKKIIAEDSIEFLPATYIISPSGQMTKLDGEQTASSILAAMHS